jgi:hypothetical protein
MVHIMDKRHKFHFENLEKFTFYHRFFVQSNAISFKAAVSNKRNNSKARRCVIKIQAEKICSKFLTLEKI